jgi:hypothetical protein
MQIAFAVTAFKTRRHSQPQKKQPPQDPGSHPEPGAPSVSLYFPETYHVISSPRFKCQRTSNLQSGPPGLTFISSLCLGQTPVIQAVIFRKIQSAKGHVHETTICRGRSAWSRLLGGMVRNGFSGVISMYGGGFSRSNC